jgi:RNA polymerase sigma factor (sigma-70 family)
MENAVTIPMPMAAERNNNITQTIKEAGRRLFGFIRKRVGSTEDAEDILQEVFYQLAGNNEPIEQTTAWLYRVARNKITDSYRKHKLPLVDDVFDSSADDDEAFNWKEIIPSADAGAEANYLRNLFWDELNTALDELPEEQRYAFIQNEIEGVAFKDMAEETGESVATLISRKRYAVLHLRSKLQNLKNELLNN